VAVLPSIPAPAPVFSCILMQSAEVSQGSTGASDRPAGHSRAFRLPLPVPDLDRSGELLVRLREVRAVAAGRSSPTGGAGPVSGGI
jgi:hypothetical protein